ncbi:MAG: pentapeptide repeat-containing protein [Ferrimicrobium acidiphilum]
MHISLVALVDRENEKETKVIRCFIRVPGNYGRTGGIMDRLANNFRRADFGDIPLRGEDFSGANLRRGNLRRADLRDTNFRGANLRRADLRGADLRGADLTGADLKDVLVDESTILPVGYVVEDGRVVRV